MENEMKNEETLKFMETAQLVFMVNFKENTQNISIGQDVNIAELLSAPFRLSVHLNNVLESSFTDNEGQEGSAVEEAEATEDTGA